MPAVDSDTSTDEYAHSATTLLFLVLPTTHIDTRSTYLNQSQGEMRRDMG